MANSDALAERLEKLEHLAAYQEETNEALNEAVIRLGEENAALRREIDKLRGMIESIGAHPALAPEDEPPPPHY